MEYFNRNSNGEFIQTYGKDAIIEVFKVAKGGKSDRVDLLFKTSTDRYQFVFEGVCLLDGEIIVEFSYGDYIPDEILYFGDHVPGHVPENWKREIKLNKIIKNI